MVQKQLNFMQTSKDEKKQSLKMDFLDFLCTSAFLYVPYSFLLLISFVMGGSSAVMLLNRTNAVMLLNCTGGVVWALKPP